MGDIINDLTDAEIDVVLERLDQTERPIQRRIVCTLVLRYEAGQKLAAVCRKCADRVGQVPAWIIELKLRAALEEWDRLAK